MSSSFAPCPNQRQEDVVLTETTNANFVPAGSQDQGGGLSLTLNLKWHTFQTQLTSGLRRYLQSDFLSDVVLVAEGQVVKSHKMLLSLCSLHFKQLFESLPGNNGSGSNTIVILNNVRLQDLKNVLEFIYNGEVTVTDNEALKGLLATGKLLQIEGLSSAGSGGDVFEQIRNSDPTLNGPGTGTTHSASMTTEVPESCHSSSSISELQNTTTEQSVKRIRLDKRESKRSRHALDETNDQLQYLSEMEDPLSGIVETPHASQQGQGTTFPGMRYEDDEEMITIDADVVKHEIPGDGFPEDGESDDEDTSEDVGVGARSMDGAGHSYGDQDRTNVRVANTGAGSTRTEECQCPDCGNTYKSKAAMQRHRKAIHLGVRHNCPLCHKVYMYRHHMLDHYKVCVKNPMNLVGRDTPLATTPSNLGPPS